MIQNEIRHDAFRARHVILAPGRAKRGEEGGACVFCPATLGKGDVLEKLGVGKKWKAAVVPNIFPTVSPEFPEAYGHHELVIETPEHEEAFEDLSPARMSEILALYARRCRKMREDGRIKYVLVFKNSGAAAGASRAHAHSQIVALDFEPDLLKEESARVFAERQAGHCAACDENRREATGPRLISKDRLALAFEPRVSAFPYETVIRTRHHVDNLTAASAAEIRSLAAGLHRTLSGLKRLGAAYNFYIHDLVGDADQHLEIHVIPRVGLWGGLEFASGVTVNTVTPERAAGFLKKVVK